MTEKPPMDHRAALPEIDVREHGAKRGEVEQVMDRRLFVQLLVFTAPTGVDPERYDAAFRAAFDENTALSGTVYADANDPRGFGLLTWSEQPEYFVDEVRPMFRREHLRDLTLRPEMTMLGRTYATGYEQNLPFWLLERPVDTVTNPAWGWHVWYPLRRIGAFERLPEEQKRSILGEHGLIGRAYGATDLAHDVRLACHGLDANDNEFVIGLIGPALHPLSHVVQSMRRTVQTSEYMQHMGPFFVGRVRFQKR
ncbi:MAG: chlorite dismutase family protein [Myxococcales bacterium]|nr:chlorite dismutase family protein [Myxococcales bacterium]